MVHLAKKKIKGKIYLYLEETARVDGKSRRVWQKYLGSEQRIKEQLNIQLKSEFTVTNLDFGLPIALLQIAEKLDLVKIINEYTTKRDQGISVGKYILFAALNRCVKPTSKNKIRKWFESTILAQKYHPIDTYFDAKAYSNHFQYLTPEIIEEIETSIQKKLIKEFNVKMDTLFYDPTNFFTYINPKASQTLPKHGHSKENRFTLNLVGLSLFCSSDGGIPILHDVYPGNMQDAPLFRDEIKRLRKRLSKLDKNPQDLCLVFDKGNLSKDAFQEIDDMKIHFVASIRPSTQKEFHTLTSDDFTLVELPNKKKVGILEYKRKLYGKSRRLIVTFNPKRAKWQGKNLDKKLNKKIDEIQEFFKTRLNVKKWTNPGAVKLKIEKIIKIKKHFQWIDYVVSGTEGNVSYSASINQGKLEEHYKTLGKSYLISNHPTMSKFDIVWLFRQQYTVEQAFKYLKSPNLLMVKPIFHQNDECIRGHLFSCIIGLLLMMLLVRKVQKQFPEMSFIYISELLSEIELSVIKFKGSQKLTKKICEISPDAKILSEYLNLKAEI
jgi:transposase